MKIDGGCHCGYLTYEAEIDETQISVCHCTDCQALSGTAFRVSARSREGAFTQLTGEPKEYIKIGSSGAQRIQAFCPECGSQIYSTSVGDGPKLYNLRTGTIRQRAELVPVTQQWTRSELPWIDGLASIPKFERTYTTPDQSKSRVP